MLRLIHNRSIVKYVLAIVGIIIAGYFAWMFYPFGEWSGHQFLTDVPLGPQMLGLICAAILGGLVLILLFHKEYMKEDVKAYGAIKKDKSYENALNMFFFFVMGMELFSILFRITVLGTGKYNTILFGVGLMGMALTYIIGKVLHAQVNRPASVEAARVMNDAGNLVLERGGKDMHKLSSDDLREVHNKNLNPLNKFHDMKAARRQRKEQEEYQRHMDWLTQQQVGEQAAQDFLKPRSKTTDPVDIMEPQSQNGRTHTTSFH